MIYIPYFDLKYLKNGLLTAVLAAICWCLPTSAYAEENKTMLLINTYSENAPWSRSLMEPISTRIAQVDNVHMEMVNLNSAEITDSAKYYSLTDKIFEAFRSKHPDYVVMVGNMAATLVDRISKEWHNVPMILISRIDKYAPLNYYFAGYEGESDWDNLPDLKELRSKYNLSYLVIPDHYKENIDLIKRTIPSMKKLVFISDHVFTNRVLDRGIRQYLKSKYPDIEYEWLQASDSTIKAYEDIMLNRTHDTGYLLSTWDNAHNYDNDMLSIKGGQLHMMSSSANPIFSMREAYLDMGAIGGVYPNTKEAREDLKYLVNKMLNGEKMSYLTPFNLNDPTTVINHARMSNFDLTEEDFGSDTIYKNRVPTLWEQNRNEILACIVILILIVVAVVIYIYVQRKRIVLLQTHASFIKNMPWAYSKATILYNHEGEIYDVEYKLSLMNSAFLKLLSDNLLPKMEWKIFPFKFISEKTKQLVETEAPVSFTYHFEKTDTYYEFLLCRINPHKLKPGQLPKEIDIFANDITKRIQMQRKLRDTMRTLDVTLNVARIIPWQWDMAKGMISYDGFRMLNHPTKDKEKGDDIKNTLRKYTIDEELFLFNVHPDDRERIRQLLNDFKEGKCMHKRTEFKITYKRHNKERDEWVEINAALTDQGSNGESKTVLGSLLVITERKRQEKALIDAKEKASESDRMKSAFLANMSHEIRTPLNAIVGFSSLLTQTNDQAQKKKFSGIIEHNNDLLLHLINDVLDLAKIESNTLDLHYADTDLNELMNSLYETVRLRIAQGVVFNKVLGAEECFISTDANRLSQVLINLLTNASKFTTKGSISYGYEINGDEIEFFVRDTGIGISKENQAKLFQRFSKLNNFAQGTGLGLSICKSFIEKMGGMIWVKSRGEGKGTTFYFTLPYRKAQKVLNTETAEGTIIDMPEISSGDVTILIAEDNESNYILFESILSKHYKLIHAYNGQEAVDLYKKHKPNLILMDIKMPVMDGFEATKEIRKISQMVPIIAVTAHAFVSEKDKILKGGFNGYVAKPINQNDLINNVQHQLSKRFFII